MASYEYTEDGGKGDDSGCREGGTIFIQLHGPRRADKRMLELGFEGGRGGEGGSVLNAIRERQPWTCCMCFEAESYCIRDIKVS